MQEGTKSPLVGKNCYRVEKIMELREKHGYLRSEAGRYEVGHI